MVLGIYLFKIPTQRFSEPTQSQLKKSDLRGLTKAASAGLWLGAIPEKAQHCDRLFCHEARACTIKSFALAEERKVRQVVETGR